MKPLLSRKGSLLDTAPSFLVRRKPNNTVRFAIPPQDAEDASPIEDAGSVTAPAVRVTPLRPISANANQTNAVSMQVVQVADAEALLRDGELATFRAFNSFAYSASLLFHARELAYYAILYHENAVWRVLKASDIDAAEPAFRHFADQATRLAEAEIRRAYLEAQNAQFQRQIAESEARVERKRDDIQRAAAQDQQVALRQQELHKELTQLEARRISAQVQLNKLHRQLHQLNGADSDVIARLPNGR